MSADREVAAAAGPAPIGSPVSSLVATSEARSLAAAVLSTPTAVTVAHTESTDVLCTNCGATVTGHFCSHCGQKNEHPVHSLWHFVNEATEDLTHADSRIWQTLGALLFKPGFLTTEFLAGRRVKYLPPIRLYLVMSVLFFLFAALSPHHQLTPSERAEISRQAHGREFIVLGDPLSQPLEERRQHARVVCARVDARWNARLHAGLFQAALKSAIHKGCLAIAEDNGNAFIQDFMHNLPRALFITLPIMAALMKLLYQRPMRYYVEHLLFLLHNYSFVFLWTAVFILLGWMISSDTIMDPLAVGFFLYAMYYFFRSMRRVYPEVIGRTSAKFTALSCGYLVVVGTAVVATGVYSVLAQ